MDSTFIDRHPSGYAFRDTPDGRLLLPANDETAEPHLIDHPGLFLEFAETTTPITEASVEAWAGEWGRLWTRPSFLHEWDSTRRNLHEAWYAHLVGDEAGRLIIEHHCDNGLNDGDGLRWGIGFDDNWRWTVRGGSLSNHLWLQIANAITLDLRFRACEVCKTQMLMSGKQSSKKTCSVACRVKLSRIRKAESDASKTKNKK